MELFELIDKNPKNVVLYYNAALILSILKESCGLAKIASSRNKDIRKNMRILKKERKEIAKLVKKQQALKNYIAKLRRQIKQLKEVDLNAGKEIQGVVNE